MMQGKEGDEAHLCCTSTSSTNDADYVEEDLGLGGEPMNDGVEHGHVG